MNQLDIQKIERAGLQCKKCNDYHYQILGGTNHQIVNFWSTKKGGSKFQVRGEQARLGNLNGPFNGVPGTEPWLFHLVGRTQPP